MKFSIVDRINLLSLIPQKSDFITLKKFKEFEEKVSLTDEEVKKFNVKPNENGGLSFKKEAADFKVDISIGEIVEEKLKTDLKEMSEKKELPVYLVPLYEKIVEKQFEEKKK